MRLKQVCERSPGPPKVEATVQSMSFSQFGSGFCIRIYPNSDISALGHPPITE
jgi:hypothetical protein